VRVSAVVPCFNGERYLAEALSSIRRQTRPVDELLVVDDGSTDRSAAIAESFGATVLRQENRGEGAARNLGTRAATGEAIAWLDADDRWRPDHVAVVAGLLEENPDAAGAFGAVRCFGRSDELVVGYVDPGASRNVLLPAFRNWLHTTIGAVVRRSALLEVGGLDEVERYSVDFDLWLRMARRSPFVATSRVTAEWRWHDGQQSAAHPRQIAAVYRYRRRFVDSVANDGDRRLADSLEAEFRRVWLRDVRRAVRAGDRELLRVLQGSASVVPRLTLRDRALYGAASRAPELAVHVGPRIRRMARRW
jgi:glycosyltransferase involved in cell wall biosynthesis